MFQEFSDIKNNIKDVVDPRNVKKEITSSWSDFWNFELTTDETGAKVTVGLIVIAVLCFLVGIVISKWFSKKLVKTFQKRFQLAPSTLHIWSSLTFYVSCVLVTVVALKIAHVPLTIFTFMGGALLLGVGFGSKNLANNFISGVIFMFEGPAKMGDFVEVDGIFGRVVDVGMRATHVEIGMTRRAIIPNSNFLEKNIINWGRAGSPVYLTVSVSVDYGSDLVKAEKLLLDAPMGIAQVMETLPFRVLMKNFGDSGIQLDLSFPVQLNVPGDRDFIASEVRKKIEKAFREEKVSIPYPQLVLRKE